MSRIRFDSRLLKRLLPARASAARGTGDIAATINEALARAGLASPDARRVDAGRTVARDAVRAPVQAYRRAESDRTPPLRVPQGDAGGTFAAGRYVAGGTARDYKLFVPAGAADRPRPLVVMLHGCTQDPDDFAAGTRMNALAQEHGVVVLYPAQPPRSNAAKCWNWFQPGDQRRGGGEPALLAGMTQEIVARLALDPARVFVAGLSAGGAMAAILAREYPDVYAAAGIHSGLPAGAASDVASAFAAMRDGPPDRPVPAPRSRAATRVIVFHGDADTTVHPVNGEHIAAPPVPGESIAHAAGVAGRHYTRRTFSDRGGRVVAEHWLVHGAGHAWSGGSADGSYADPLGPDASREMLRFFLAGG